MSRPWSLVFVIAGCLGIPAVIGASCYMTIEVLHLRGPAQHLAIGGMLLLGLGPPLRWVAARSVPAQAATRRRHHERRIRQRVDELRGDPARERWIPLVEAGFPVAGSALRGDAIITTRGNRFSASCQRDLLVSLSRHTTGLGLANAPYLRNSRYLLDLGVDVPWGAAWFANPDGLGNSLVVNGATIPNGRLTAYDASRTCP